MLESHFSFGVFKLLVNSQIPKSVEKNVISQLTADELVTLSHLSVEGSTSRFVHLEKFSLNFSISSFVIRVKLRNP